MRSLIARTLAAAPLLVAVVFLALWMRSYAELDRVVAQGTKQIELQSIDGLIQITVRSSWHDLPTGRVPNPYADRWHVEHETGPAGYFPTRPASFAFGLDEPDIVVMLGMVSPRSTSYSYVRFPHWLPAAACLAPVAIPALLARRRRSRRRKLGLCTACGYDVRANEGKCSECGQDMKVETVHASLV